MSGPGPESVFMIFYEQAVFLNCCKNIKREEKEKKFDGQHNVEDEIFFW